MMAPTKMVTIRMKTANEIILEIQELPPEERQKVADYLNAEEGEEFLEEIHIIPNSEIMLCMANRRGGAPSLPGEISASSSKNQ
jgi:hypothetical protein